MNYEKELNQKYSSILADDLNIFSDLLKDLTESELVIQILRKFMNTICKKLESKYKCKLSVVCFGSLGRSEFKLKYSDLDLFFLINGSVSFDDMNEIRSCILRKLASENPWIILDNRDEIINVNLKLEDINGIDLKYHILRVDDLELDSSKIIVQRKWQLILESRCLYGDNLYKKSIQKIIPKYKSNSKINLSDLISDIPKFLLGFDDQRLIYRSARKYWKSRLTREFYQFVNIINLIINDLDENTNSINLKKLTYLKFINLLEIADSFDNLFKGQNKSYETVFLEQIKKQTSSIPMEMKYNGKRQFHTESAAIVFSIFKAVLIRYQHCRTLLYDIDNIMIMESISDGMVIGSRFGFQFENNEQEALIKSLQQSRMSYLKYMSIASDFMITYIGLKYQRTIPTNYLETLSYFKANKYI